MEGDLSDYIRVLARFSRAEHVETTHHPTSATVATICRYKSEIVVFAYDLSESKFLGKVILPEDDFKPAHHLERSSFFLQAEERDFCVVSFSTGLALIDMSTYTYREVTPNFLGHPKARIVHASRGRKAAAYVGLSDGTVVVYKPDPQGKTALKSIGKGELVSVFRDVDGNVFSIFQGGAVHCKIKGGKSTASGMFKKVKGISVGRPICVWPGEITVAIAESEKAKEVIVFSVKIKGKEISTEQVAKVPVEDGVCDFCAANNNVSNRLAILDGIGLLSIIDFGSGTPKTVAETNVHTLRLFNGSYTLPSKKKKKKFVSAAMGLSVMPNEGSILVSMRSTVLHADLGRFMPHASLAMLRSETETHIDVYRCQSGDVFTTNMVPGDRDDRCVPMRANDEQDGGIKVLSKKEYQDMQIRISPDKLYSILFSETLKKYMVSRNLDMTIMREGEAKGVCWRAVASNDGKNFFASLSSSRTITIFSITGEAVNEVKTIDAKPGAEFESIRDGNYLVVNYRGGGIGLYTWSGSGPEVTIPSITASKALFTDQRLHVLSQEGGYYVFGIESGGLRLFYKNSSLVFVDVMGTRRFVFLLDKRGTIFVCVEMYGGKSFEIFSLCSGRPLRRILGMHGKTGVVAEDEFHRLWLVRLGGEIFSRDSPVITEHFDLLLSVLDMEGLLLEYLQKNPQKAREVLRHFFSSGYAIEESAHLSEYLELYTNPDLDDREMDNLKELLKRLIVGRKYRESLKLLDGIYKDDKSDAYVKFLRVLLDTEGVAEDDDSIELSLLGMIVNIENEAGRKKKIRSYIEDLLRREGSDTNRRLEILNWLLLFLLGSRYYSKENVKSIRETLAAINRLTKTRGFLLKVTKK